MEPATGNLDQPHVLPQYWRAPDVVLSAIRNATAGAAGGAACVLAGQPFDTIKVKMQTFPGVHRGVFQCLGNTIRAEGFRALYAGSASSFLSNIAENSALFLFYGQSREFIRFLSGTQTCAELSVAQNASAGALSAVFSSLIVSPLELIKCRQQAQYELAGGVGRNRW